MCALVLLFALTVGEQRVPVDDSRDDGSNVEVLKYERKGSYVQRDKTRSMPGADHFMENPLYGMYQDENSNGFYFNMK